MVTGPEAAAAHYTATRHLDDGNTVAVYDLGGGTFDATLSCVSAGPGSRSWYTGGHRAARWRRLRWRDLVPHQLQLRRSVSKPDMEQPTDRRRPGRLLEDCVLAKEAISVDTEATIPVFLPHRQFDVLLTRAQFEEMIRAQVESTIGALVRTLRSAQVEPAERKAVLLVGGSSGIPLVAEMITKVLHWPALLDAHPKYGVALGAATLAAAISPEASVGPRTGTTGRYGAAVAGWPGRPEGAAAITGTNGRSAQPERGMPDPSYRRRRRKVSICRSPAQPRATPPPASKVAARRQGCFRSQPVRRGPASPTERRALHHHLPRPRPPRRLARRRGYGPAGCYHTGWRGAPGGRRYGALRRLAAAATPATDEPATTGRREHAHSRTRY